MLSIIVAHDRNRVIGKDNQLPWRLPNDLAFVKKTTMGKTLVMGRRTYEAIGKPLPGRRNVVLTQQTSFQAEGIDVLHSVDEILKLSESNLEEVFIFGGETIFKQLLPYVEKLYITYIDEEFLGDTYFPEIELKEWTLISKEKGIKDEKNPYDYYFLTYIKSV